MIDSCNIDVLLNKFPGLKFLGFLADNSYAQFSYFGHWFMFMTRDPHSNKYNFVKTVSDYITNNYNQINIFDLL